MLYLTLKRSARATINVKWGQMRLAAPRPVWYTWSKATGLQFQVVAIDGSVFRYHPHFPNIMKSRIQQLMGVDYKFDLMLSTDGSGRGAALVAAVLGARNGTDHSE